MEKIEAAIQFFGSYPVWARSVIAGGILISLLTLFFAPRDNSSATGSDETRNRYPFLTIEQVVLYPANPDAEVQVYALVDGTRYRYPSIGNIEWARTGPNMSTQRFQLPRNPDGYEVRFEMKFRDVFGEKEFVSQEVRRVTGFPYSDEYKLYAREGQTRSATVDAAVRYSLSED